MDFDTKPPKEQVEAAKRMKMEMEAGAQEQPEGMVVTLHYFLHLYLYMNCIEVALM